MDVFVMCYNWNFHEDDVLCLSYVITLLVQVPSLSSDH